MTKMKKIMTLLMFWQANTSIMVTSFCKYNVLSRKPILICTCPKCKYLPKALKFFGISEACWYTPLFGGNTI